MKNLSENGGESPRSAKAVKPTAWQFTPDKPAQEALANAKAAGIPQDQFINSCLREFIANVVKNALSRSGASGEPLAAVKQPEQPTLAAQKAKALFDGLKLVACSNGNPDILTHYGFGFQKDKLLYCDGRKYRPLALMESVKVFLKISRAKGYTGNSRALELWARKAESMLSKVRPL